MSQGKHMTDDEIIEANCRQNFAAARGARIQIFVAETRIHPDDEHLQYGPISTALREMAEDPPRSTEAIWPVERYYLDVYKSSEEMYVWADSLQKSLILLLVAEALADEGM